MGVVAMGQYRPDRSLESEAIRLGIVSAGFFCVLRVLLTWSPRPVTAYEMEKIILDYALLQSFVQVFSPL